MRTREQKYKDVKWNKMFVSRRRMTSEAFRSLKTAAACQVFMIFLYKCQMKNVQIRPGSRDKEWIILNNGKIQFSYREALGKWGITQKRFTKAIDELVRVGLIDITHSGFGLHKDVSLYSISDRWENFGTDEFIVVKRQKRTQNLGFTKGNSFGKNSTSKQNQRPLATVGQQT